MELSPLTATEMRAFEEYAVKKYGVTLESMMERAGRAVFEVVMKECLAGSGEVLKQVQDDNRPRPHVLVVAGKGNNGGDALVAAELLKKEGVNVTVYQPYSGHDIGEVLKQVQDDNKYNLIIDGLFGFSLKGNPRPPADEVIQKINASRIPVLSIDVPSGLDAETGQLMIPAVRATYTVTLGMPKVGLDAHKDHVGKLFLGNVGVPEKAYEESGYYFPIFLGKSYIPLH
ncbi:NAD(P)H-hydrate epimerase [Candidatus Peregrinibacteria bacterium]|nr:NAD(P)H-hydrate epimerase [Candidatus Peregrinibacteria bacterium]